MWWRGFLPIASAMTSFSSGVASVPIITPAPPAPRSTGGGVPPLSPGTAGSDGTSSSSGRGDPNVFLIHLVYESGQIQTQPVSPDTLLGQVRSTIAMTARVSLSVNYFVPPMCIGGALKKMQLKCNSNVHSMHPQCAFKCALKKCKVAFVVAFFLNAH